MPAVATPKLLAGHASTRQWAQRTCLAGDVAAAFDVARLTARALDTPELVSLNNDREALEEKIAALRLRREELGDDYLDQLQPLLVQLAELQERIDAAEAKESGAN